MVLAYAELVIAYGVCGSGGVFVPFSDLSDEGQRTIQKIVKVVHVSTMFTLLMYVKYIHFATVKPSFKILM